MKVKIFILELLIFYLLNSNFACAEHWAYIGTSNGKPADIDIDSIKYNPTKDWLVQYNVRRFEQNKMIITGMEKDLKNYQVTILNNSVYKNNMGSYEFLKTESNTDRTYKPIKDGSVNWSVYKMFMERYSPDHHW